MQLSTALPFFISSLVTALVSSIVFLLASPPESLVLFSLFFLLTSTITLTILGKTFVIKIQLKVSETQLFILTIPASVALIILQMANIFVEPANAILYVITFIFALGFSILRISKFRPGFSRIEYLALAYPLSLASLTIFGTIALTMPSRSRGLMISIIIAFLCIVSFLMEIKEGRTEAQKHHELKLTNNELIVGTTLLIFVYFFIELYPQIANSLELDIARNFLAALAFTKDTFGSFSNLNALFPLFGIYQSSMIYIVKPSVEIFQITMIFLNLLAVLSFYAMASQYLKRINDHTPSIAALVWSMFAGFGWLNFLTNRIENPNISLLSLIGHADVFSYGDITWRRSFFYLSMEASFTLVFAALYFLKRDDLSKTKQVLLMALLITPIPLMHPYGTCLLLPILLCFALFCAQELRQQLNCTANSLIIASFASMLLNYVLDIKSTGIPINILTFSSYLLTGLALIAITSFKGRTSRTPDAIVRERSDNRYIIAVATLLLLFFFAFLLLWLSGNSSFNFGSLNFFGYVPIFLYPVKLGITGVLAIASFYIIFANLRFRSRELVAFLASVLLMIFVSILLAALQLQYSSEFILNPTAWLSETIRQNILSFRGERTFEIFKVPLAILASVVLVKIGLIQSGPTKAKLLRYFAVSGLISLIFISGMASTFLGFEYWNSKVQANSLSSSELSMITNLQNSMYANEKAIITGPQTPTSYMELTGATAIVQESPAAWQSRSPELPLFVTRYSETTPTYFYLQKTSDFQGVSDYYGSYLEHLSNEAQTYLENAEFRITTINNDSTPTPKSSSALIIPYDEGTMTVSKPFYQENLKQSTVLSLYFEEKVQSLNYYKEPISYNNVEISETAVFNGKNSYIRINGTDTNFDEVVVEFGFQPLNLTTNQVIVSKFDWGTPTRKSWEIAQYGRRLVFKISPDGDREEVLMTSKVLALDTQYAVVAQFDGALMKILLNDKLEASRIYQGSIFKSNVDLTVGAELYENQPAAFANMKMQYVQVLNDIPPIQEPIFYAYDILSSTGLNYTTVLSGDNTISSYKTLILPYDDITTYETLMALQNRNEPADTRHILIMNTNGYGPLLNLFGNRSPQEFSATLIFANEDYKIQTPTEVPIIKLHTNTEMKGQYTNNTSQSPLIMTTTQNETTLVYVNIYPMLSHSSLLDDYPIHFLTESLSWCMAVFDESTVSPWFTESSLLFKGFTANGTASLSSDSIASIDPQVSVNVNIQTDDSRYIFENVTSVSLAGYDSVNLNSSRITVQKGFGFYTTLIANDPAIIIQSNHDASVSIGSRMIEGQTIGLQINGRVAFLIRQPKIHVRGEIEFQNLYMLHPPTIYTDGRNITLKGDITLNIYVSDESTIALPYRLNSPITVKYETPLMEFNETTSILLATPYIVLVLILIATILLIRRYQSGKNMEAE